MAHINHDIDRLRQLRRRILYAVDAAAAIARKHYPVLDREPDWVEAITVNVTRRHHYGKPGPCDTMDDTIESLVEIRNSINEEVSK